MKVTHLRMLRSILLTSICLIASAASFSIAIPTPLVLEGDQDLPRAHHQHQLPVNKIDQVGGQEASPGVIGRSLVAAAKESGGCPGSSVEDMTRLLSSNQFLLRKVLQVYVAKNGIKNTKDLIQDVLGKFSSSVAAQVASGTNSVEDNESESGSLTSSEGDKLESELNFNKPQPQQPHQTGHFSDATLEEGEEVLERSPVHLRPWRGPLGGSGGLGGSSTEAVALVPSPSQVVRFSSRPRIGGGGGAMSGGPGSETVLIIPGRRLRPQGSRVRITAKNKNREVRIVTSPQMNVLQALKAAELKIQWQWPELSNDKVIDFAHLDSMSCYVVRRVGPVEADEAHSWLIKVTYKSGEQAYKGPCLPSDEEDVVVRPGSTIDLIYFPTKALSSSAASSTLSA